MRFPSILICLTGPALLAAEIEAPSNLAALDATRIGVVAVQNRSKEQVLEDGVDAALAAVLRAESLQPVPLAFQPPADVEYAARQAGCAYILYTDIVAVRRTHGQRTVAHVEFRLFALDEVLPRISTTVTASSKTGARLPGNLLRHSVRTPNADSFLAALTAALAREARMVRAEVSARPSRKTFRLML